MRKKRIPKQLGIVRAVIASGPVILKNKKILVVLDDKDPFLKFPGGRIHYKEDLKKTCLRRTKEEIGVNIEIIRPLDPMLLWKKPHTGEKIPVVLIHWLSKLKPKQIPRKGKLPRKIFWIDSKYKGHKLAPNVQYFLKNLKKEKKIN
ncbi:MAG: NUDIX domain-containing protein [Candidatus Pacearchaeota archaeon]|nr:MAG: NUDIX domain-containing protein [Candidatus Pacearchaeota archaeon]